MKNFKSFIVEATVENEKIVQKLEKTRRSMHNHWKGGGEMRHRRGLELIYRYDELVDKLKSGDREALDHWRAYCKKHNYDSGHKGHDFYA